MLIKFKASLILLVSIISLNISALDKNQLIKTYKDVSFIDATMIQTKHASYLLKPLESKVHFLKSKKGIIWEVLEPLPFKIEFDSKGMLIGSQSDLEDLGGNPIVRQKIRQITELLDHIFTANISAFEKYFVVKIDENSLTATPKDQSVPLNYKITMVFDAQLNLQSLQMTNTDEELNFKVLSFKKNNLKRASFD